jgi:hypothetical protein
LALKTKNLLKKPSCAKKKKLVYLCANSFTWNILERKSKLFHVEHNQIPCFQSMML